MSAQPKPDLHAVPTFETPARAALASHMDHVDDALAVLADVEQQRARFKGLMEAERQALSKLEAVKAEQADDMADAVREGKMLPGNNTDEIAEAEHAVRVAKRDADSARIVIPRLDAQHADSLRAVNQLKSLAPPLIGQVLVEESARLGRDVMAETERLRARAATIWGLRKLMAGFQQKEMRPFFGALGDVHFELPLPSDRAASDECDGGTSSTRCCSAIRQHTSRTSRSE